MTPGAYWALLAVVIVVLLLMLLDDRHLDPPDGDEDY